MPVQHRYVTEVLADAPAAFWRLNESATPFADSSPNAAALSIAQGTPTLGVTGGPYGQEKSLLLRYGQVDYLSSSMASNLADVTFEVWYKGTDTDGLLVSSRGGAGVAGFRVGIGTSPGGQGGAGKVYAGVSDSGLWVGVGGTTTRVDDGKWHHIVATLDSTAGSAFSNTQVKVYIDGYLEPTTGSGSGGTSPLGNAGFKFGYNANEGSPNLEGNLSNLAIYPTALTAARVKTHWLAGSSPLAAAVLADSPLAYYRLGETTGTTAFDSSGNGRDGTYENGVTLGAAGLALYDPDLAATFDGVDDRVTTAYAAWMDQPSFTIEAIIKPTSLTGTGTIASRYDSWQSGSFGGSSFQFRREGSQLRMYIFNAGGEGYVGSSVALVANQTYHVAATYDGATGTVTLYQDGAVVGTGTRTGMNATTRPFQIGRTQHTTAGEPFAGSIDEVAYYGTVLSGTRIGAHFDAARDRYRFEVLKDSPWGYWRQREGLGDTSLADETGNARPLAVTGTPAFNKSGSSTGKAIDWPADTGVYAASAGGVGGGGVFTMEAWVYLTAAPSGRVVLLGLGDNPTGSGFNNAALSLNAGGYPTMYAYIGGENHWTSPDPLSLNQWHHIVGVWQAGTNAVRLRVDGVTKVTASPGSMPSLNNKIWLHAGHNNTAQAVRIAEPAYYNTALSDTRIDTHYLKGIVGVPMFQAVETDTARQLRVAKSGSVGYTNPSPSGNITVVASGSSAEVVVPGMDTVVDPGVACTVTIDLWEAMNLSGTVKGCTARLRDGGPTGTVLASRVFTDAGDSTGGHQQQWSYSGTVTPATERLCVTIQNTTNAAQITSDTRTFTTSQAYAGGPAGPVLVPLNQVVETETVRPIGLIKGIRQVAETGIAQPIQVLKEPNPFAMPRVLSGDTGTLTWDMTDADLETGEPNPNGATKTGWFQWTAPDDLTAVTQRFHTRGSDADTTLAVFTGDTFGTLVQVAISDNAVGDDADLVFPVTAGTTYRIQVGTKSLPAVATVLTWLPVAPFPYDAFAAPLELPGGYGGQEFGTANGSVEVGEPVPVGTDATSWLSWTAETADPIVFTVRGIEADPFTVTVFTGSTLAGLTQVAQVTGSGSQEVTFTPVVGTVYLLQVAVPDDLRSFEIGWAVVAPPVEPLPLPVPPPPDDLPDPAAPRLPMLHLRVEVYERDGLTKITEVPRRFGVRGYEPLNVVGNGEVSVHAQDEILTAYPDLFAYGNVVKFWLGGVCVHGFVIKRRRTRYVQTDEWSGYVRTVAGPSVMRYLEDFTVRHDGEARPDSLDVRSYTWASKPSQSADGWYDPADWDDPVNEWSLANPPGSGKKEKKPKNWKVRSARWINVTSGGGWRYFRKNVAVGQDGTLVRLFATADEWWRVYLDGELVMTGDRREVGYTEFKRYDTVLSKGQHTIAALARAFPSKKGDGNDSFLFAMCEVDLNGKIVKPPLLVSDNSWKAHAGNPPPGWNRAQVLKDVVKEAKQRGVQSALRLSFGFTGLEDSAGKKWTDRFNKEVQIGSTALNLQEMLSEGNGFDVWVDPEDLTLHAWRRRGRDVSASVTLEPGRNLLDWEVEGTDEVLNDWLIQYDGGWTTYQAKGSQEDYEIREAYVALDGIKDDNSARDLMKRASSGIAKAQDRAGTGEIRKKPSGQPSGGLVGVDGAYPFLDFGVGDTVKAPNEDGRLVPQRLLALTLIEDEDGMLTFDPEVEEIKSV